MHSHSLQRRSDGNSYAEILLASSSSSNGNDCRNERGMRYTARCDQPFNRGGSRNTMSIRCNGNARPIASKSNSTLNFRAAVMKNASNHDPPLAFASTNGISTFGAPSNTYNQNKSIVPSDTNNMHIHHGHYHRHKTQDDNPKSTHIKEQHNERNRRPLTSYNYQTNRKYKHSTSNTKPKHLFHNNHTISELIQIAHSNLDTLKPSMTAAFWNKLMKQMIGDNATKKKRLPNNEDLLKRLDQIFQHTLRNLDNFYFYPIALSQIIYSMAKLVDVLRKKKLSRSKRGENVINDKLKELLLSSDMTLKSKLFHAFASTAAKMIHKFEARSLSNIAYAYALIDYVPVFEDEIDLFDYIAERAIQRVTEFNSQEIANSVWAYATVDARHEKLFEKVYNHIITSIIMERFKPQDISNTVLDRFDPQALANTVWSYATTDIKHPGLLEKVADHIVSSHILDRFITQHIANTVWAYATVGAFRPMLFENVADHIIESNILDRFEAQHLANTVWAYATAEAHHPSFFEEVSKQIIESNILDRFDSQHLVNTLWAYASMGIANEQLFTVCALKASNLIESLNSQQLAILAWTYAVADIDAPNLFNEHFINACVYVMEQFEIEYFRQLHQWHLWRTHEISSTGLPDERSQRCFEEFISEEPTVSRIQTDVVAQLSSIGLVPEEEVLLESGYRIDAIVEVDGNAVGVEVDGPTHFIGKSRSPTGSTTLKRRQVLLIDGIELVSVPYWDWCARSKRRREAAVSEEVASHLRLVGA